jgi:hypothetical protein
MPKTTTNADTVEGTEAVADSNDSGGSKLIAEWVGSDRSPRIKGQSARELSKKDVKDGLVMDITKNLRWGPETNYRVDVTEQPEPFQNWLREQAEFKVTEE